MIYNAQIRDFQFAVFACDIDEKFFTHFGEDWLDVAGAEGWLRHNRKRIYLRAYVFCDSVLERHHQRKMGFKDPVIIWGQIKTGTFSVHPGNNRIILKMLLPEVRQVGWIVDNTCHSRKQYEGIFNNIQPLVRNERGDRKLIWQMQHRSNVGGEDQYHQHLNTDTYLGNKEFDTVQRAQKWTQLTKTRGFGCYIGDKFHYNIGKPNANYDFHNIAGIYQAFLHHFFDFSYDKWDELYFRRIT